MVDLDKPIDVKAVLLGDTSVGKTSIFNQIINHTFIEEGISSTSAYFRPKFLEVPGYP